MDLASVASRYRQQGFGLVRSVFSLDEVVSLRERVAAVHRRENGKIADLVSYDELRDVVLDDRILAIARAVLGNDVVYFGDSTFVADSRFDRHLHNDARGDDRDPSRSDYPMMRFGIYLQDHAVHSDGLKLRPGSHRSVFWNARNFARLLGVGPGDRLSARAFRPRPFYNVPTEPGDVVFWSLRMHHSAHAVRLRGLDGVALPTALEGYVPARLRQPGPGSRYACFFTLAAPGDHLRPYIRDLAYSASNREFWGRCTFDAAPAVRACEAKRVTVVTDALRLAKMA